MERTIKVKGCGKLSVKPDLTVVKINIEGISKNYNDVLEMSSTMTNEIKNLLSSCLINKDDIKTSYFNIDIKYDSFRDDEGKYHKGFIGYSFNETLSFSFDLDNILLGKILYSLNKCTSNPEVNVSFTIKNKDALKDKLLKMSINDAKSKAMIIAMESGVSLKEIQSIVYGTYDNDLTSNNMGFGRVYACNPSNDGLSMDVTPLDIVLEDSVEIIYRID